MQRPEKKRFWTLLPLFFFTVPVCVFYICKAHHAHLSLQYPLVLTKRMQCNCLPDWIQIKVVILIILVNITLKKVFILNIQKSQTF